MQKKSLSTSRSRAEILAEIAALPPSVQGRISSYKNVRKNGTTVIYNNLQWWADGRNHALFIPADKVSQIKEAIKQGKKMQKLVRELSLADAQEIIASGSAYNFFEFQKSLPNLFRQFHLHLRQNSIISDAAMLKKPELPSDGTPTIR